MQRRILDAAPSRTVVWLALGVLLIAFGLFAMDLALGRQRIFDQAEADARTQAKQLADHATKIIGIHSLILKNAEWVYKTQGWDGMAGTPMVHDWLRQLAGETPEVQSYWLVDDKGDVRVNTFHWPAQPLNVADRPYFTAQTERDRGPFIGGRMSGRLNPEIFFAISRRIEGTDGRFQGVAQVSLRPAYFEAFYASVAAQPGVEVMLVRDDGNVLVRHPALLPAPLDLPSAKDLLAQATLAQGDRYLLPGLSPFDGKRRLYTVSAVERLPLRIVYGIDRARLDRAWLESSLAHISFALVAFMLLLPLAAIALRQTRQIEQAQADLRSANSDLEQRVAERTAHLDTALHDLRRSEERLTRLVATVPVGIIELDSTGLIIDTNAAAEQILGQPQSALVGVHYADPCWQISRLSGEPLPAAEIPAGRALAGETITGYELSMRDIRTGARQIVAINAAPIRAGDGKIIGCTATIIDATARYEAEDRQRLLMREVDHRAKNALAVAQAVVRLSKGDTIRDFTRAVEGRISSLARSHSLLAQAAWAGADLRRLIEDEITGFTQEEDQLLLQGPDVQLGADQVQSLGLAFHELATNAAKYGALSQPEGHIQVRWQVQRAVLHLEWMEQGGPPVTAPPAHKGFGSTLLGQVLRHQLGGDMAMEWTSAGLICRLTLPLE
ncbi:sensor histidine kinase [Niveispirillum irakense]|uniref:sensor histidine kinase n=1 Tax=Niveispirillum irakense TaxID=34011 RepID=UPI00040B0739|nr:HWE histidine kinase domain-containing protein [Niveispirillum irakense]